MKKSILPLMDTGIFLIAVTQFGLTFSYNFIMTFMPFYIIKISPFGPKETMLWTGLIMGAPSVIAGLTCPLWGRLTSRLRPKFLLEQGVLSLGVILLLFGFATNLYFVLFLRILLGVLGGVSTVGLVLISNLSPKERMHKDISLFQNAITAGQLIAPPIGAYMVTLTGYLASFLIAAFIVSVFFFFCRHYVKDIPCQKYNPNPGKHLQREVLWGWGLGLIATIHITYIPSILPHILETFQIKGGTALNSAGMIMMAYMATAVLGTYFINHLVPRANLRQAVLYVGLLAAFFQAVMYFGHGVISFTLIRMLETGTIAAIFPMILSLFASSVGSNMLGVLNSSRYIGNAVGPMMATSIVAYSGLLPLYLIIAGLTLASLWGFSRATQATQLAKQEE